jgi:hypothetical protein
MGVKAYVLRKLVSDEVLRNKIALAYLVVGIAKVASALSFILIPDTMAKIPLLNKLVKSSEDHTIAGKLYEYVYLAIGVYAVIAALALYHLFPPSVSTILQNKFTEYTLFVLLGLLLIVFYGLVIYTDVPIPKNKDNYKFYNFWGVLGGVVLVCMPLLTEVVKAFIPVFKGWSNELQSAIILGLSLIVYTIANLVFIYINQNQIKLPPYIQAVLPTLGTAFKSQPPATK